MKMAGGQPKKAPNVKQTAKIKVQPKKPLGAKATQKQPQQPNVPPSKAQPNVPPKVAAKASRRLVFWEGNNDLNLEDITFVVPIVISLVILGLFLLRKYIRWTVQCQSSNRLDGKTVVITGANTGIGKATATELARRGAKVVMGIRDKKKGEAVALNIRARARNQDVYALELDLASFSSIKMFADELNNREPLVHVLINNAAYMGPKNTTVDGFEKTFGVNYLGHFLLTNLLAEKLKRASPSRVVNLVSDSYSLGKLDFEDLSMANYDLYKAYARSKLAMVLFNHELHKRMARDIVCSFGVHPGMVCTDLLRNWPGFTGNLLRCAARILFKSPEDGCQTVVFCAVADKLGEHSGRVLENCSLYKIKNFAKDNDISDKLWKESLQLCDIEVDQVAIARKKSVAFISTEGLNLKASLPAVQEIGPSETKKDQ